MFSINRGALPTNPGGAQGQIQWNNEGAFYADNAFSISESAGGVHLELSGNAFGPDAIFSIESNNAEITLGQNGGNGSAITDNGNGLSLSSIHGGITLNTVNGCSYVLDEIGNFIVEKVGGGIQIAEGANGKQGVATMVGGTVTVDNTNVAANSRIMTSRQAAGGTLGELSVTVNAGVSFTITSTSNIETSIIAYVIFAPPDA